MMSVTEQTTAAPQPLGRAFDHAVGCHGDAVALRWEQTELTYRELALVIDRAEGVLRRYGVRRSSRVAVRAANSVEFVAVVLAVARLGAVVVLVSTSWREREVAHAIEVAAPTHLVHDGAHASCLGLVGISLDSIRVAPPADHHEPVEVDVDDLAVLVFSSGTTGMPKAVQHTHRSMWHAMRHWSSALGLTHADRLQIVTPPFHILGLLNLLVVLDAGASARLHRRFDVDEMLRTIQTDGITIEMAVAPIALAMASHPDLERFDLSSLRYVMWGATPVTASVADTVTRRTGVRFLAAYGASELPVMAVNPVDRPDEWRLDSVGVVPDGVELRVVDLETGAPVAPGVAGELQGRSPSLMRGYLPDDADADSFVDGWYRTGDVGTVDADGWVTITDRVKEMIKVNGFQVAPAEVEAVLLGHAAVADCAVFGVPDARTGEAVVGAVRLHAGTAVGRDELSATVASQLASYKRLADVVVVDEVPRLPSGKVLRRELHANYRNREDGRPPHS